MEKVFVVTNSLTGGGAERAMNLVCSEISKKNQDDFQITLVPINQGPRDLIDPNCRVIPIERKWRGTFSNTVFSYLKFISLVVREKPKVMILNCALPEIFACFIPIKTSFVIVEHSRNPWLGRESLGLVVRRILKLRKSTFIAVSAHLKIWSLPEIKARTIPNPVFQVTKYSNEKNEKSIKRLVFIGRLATDKNPETFIKILRRLQHPGLVIGDGVLMEGLKKQSAGKLPDVEFVGHNLEPWKLLKGGDLLIVPSKFEGDGLVIAEAVLGGFPLLASQISEFRRFYLSEYSYCDSEEEFIARIQEFSLKIDDLIPATLAVELLKNERGSDVIGNSWKELIYKLIAT